MRAPKTFFSLAMICVLALLLVSCGSGGGSGSSSSASTGSVAVLLTDYPSSEFSEINVTITKIELLSDTVHVTIFTDSNGKKINLLDLMNETTLLTIENNVPAIWYDKIRLIASEVELVKPDPNDPDQVEKYYPHLPGNGKIDLNPRMPFYVKPGQMLTIQLDLDAEKSIHIVETNGKTEYKFRPVVFIDVIDGTNVPGKLVRLSGTVSLIEEGRIQICSNSNADPDSDPDYCVFAYITPDTSFFSEALDGEPVPSGDLQVGDKVTVIGLFRMPAESNDNDGDGDMMGVDAIVVEIGVFKEKLKGTILSEPDANNQFLFEIASSQGYATGFQILVQLYPDQENLPGTKIYSSDGDPLDATSIKTGTMAEIDGIELMIDGNVGLNAAFILIDTSTTPETEISGAIQDINYDTREFNLQTSTDLVCVNVPETAEIFYVEETDGSQVNTPIDFSQLENGMQADLYGNDDPDGPCFIPNTIIAHQENNPT